MSQVRSRRGRLDKLKKLLHNLVSLLLKTQRRSEDRLAGPLFNNLTTDKCGHLVRAHGGGYGRYRKQSIIKCSLNEVRFFKPHFL